MGGVGVRIRLRLRVRVWAWVWARIRIRVRVRPEHLRLVILGAAAIVQALEHLIRGRARGWG